MDDQRQSVKTREESGRKRERGEEEDSRHERWEKKKKRHIYSSNKKTAWKWKWNATCASVRACVCEGSLNGGGVFVPYLFCRQNGGKKQTRERERASEHTESALASSKNNQ